MFDWPGLVKAKPTSWLPVLVLPMAFWIAKTPLLEALRTAGGGEVRQIDDDAGVVTRIVEGVEPRARAAIERAGQLAGGTEREGVGS